ncbi:MAG: formate dehydrogenase accessory sulfurtransferase FdhD [Cyclobacteriaceae bacterium]|nr:formate dehydrogenase accessory sulfurtransferase FdhD [Cyclobacteriaceae bacterium]
MKTPINHISLTKLKDGLFQKQEDLIAVEEPMEIRVGFGKVSERQQRKLAVTMRTPGQDLELAVGFLYTEGIIRSYSDIESVKHCDDLESDAEKGNIVRVELTPEVIVNLKSIERNFYTTSSCGVCGKTSIDSIKTQQIFSIPIVENIITQQTLLNLTSKVTNEQTVFTHTGGIHASALFDLNGGLLTLREDVGRHNALDKLIGDGLLHNKLPLQNNILWVSGRASFELVQKASMAGIIMLVAIGAPSSLAVQLADETAISLIGFSKNNSFNIYSHPERIKI